MRAQRAADVATCSPGTPSMEFHQRLRGRVKLDLLHERAPKSSCTIGCCNYQHSRPPIHPNYTASILKLNSALHVALCSFICYLPSFPNRKINRPALINDFTALKPEEHRNGTCQYFPLYFITWFKGALILHVCQRYIATNCSFNCTQSSAVLYNTLNNWNLSAPRGRCLLHHDIMSARSTSALHIWLKNLSCRITNISLSWQYYYFTL